MIVIQGGTSSLRILDDFVYFFIDKVYIAKQFQVSVFLYWYLFSTFVLSDDETLVHLFTTHYLHLNKLKLNSTELCLI